MIAGEGTTEMINRFAVGFAVAIFLCSASHPAFADQSQSFRVANYNVENLFDLDSQGTEYREYIPYGARGWNNEMLDIKLRHLARVIFDLKADILALEEVESKKALFLLRDKLKSSGTDYGFSAMAETDGQAVGCALLSRFPITMKKDITVENGRERNILKVVLDIHGQPLTVYVNHWVSKKHPESRRRASALALKRDLRLLPSSSDFLLIGDFNSDYDEYRRFIHDDTLNDTGGRTGVNHDLKTLVSDVLIDEKKLCSRKDMDFLYNLWLEIPLNQRWSYNFFGKKGSLDSMLVPASLYDHKGISYRDNSFKRFTPDYLFSRGAIYRWQMDKSGKGRHLGRGYSDHLPVYADFTSKTN